MINTPKVGGLCCDWANKVPKASGSSAHDLVRSTSQITSDITSEVPDSAQERQDGQIVANLQTIKVKFIKDGVLLRHAFLLRAYLLYFNLSITSGKSFKNLVETLEN